MIALSPSPTIAKTRTSPIRVSFVIDSLSRAGTESQLLALLRTLDRDVVEPTLVLLDGTSELSRSLEPHDLPVLRLGVTKLFSRRGLSAGRQLRAFWTQHRPNAVQAYFLDSAYFAVPIAKLCGVKKCIRVRNNLGYWLTRKHRLLERLLRPLVDVTLTNSDTGREALHEQGVTRVAVIENGVDLEAFPQVRRSNAEVACVANLREVKNIDGLMRAAAIVLKHRPEESFAVAGEGPEREKLESLRTRLGIGNTFHLPGSIREVPAFLATRSIAVLPSHSEGMSNALLEAMAAGCAIVATDVGANAKVLGGCGIVVPPRDDVALAAAILRLMDDNDLTRSLGERARQRVEAQFSREAMRLRFEEFYKSVVLTSSSPPS